MPQGKQEQYEDAIGSIFDFIFAESEKPPSKSKPLKVTGIDGTSEIVDALAAAVENPAMFVNNNTLEAFQDFVDIDLAKIQLDDRGGAIKFNLKNIGQIVRDPGKYVDSQFKRAEAIRKSQRMASTGESMRGVVAGSWATKKGLDYETRTALAQVGRGDEFSSDMKARADKLMQKHFSSGSYSVKKRHLIDKYGPKKGEELFNFYRKAEKAYHTGTEKDRAAIFSGKAGNISDLYSFLEAENIREKASFETDPQKKQDYRSASRFIENMSAVGELRKVMDESKKRMKFHQDQIKVLKEQGAPKSDIDQHRKSIRDLRSDYNAAQRYEFAGKMGTFEGHWNTAKDLFVDGNLLPNIINGNFFNDNSNKIGWLQPAKQFERTFTTNVGLSGNRRVEGKVKFLDVKEGSNKFEQAYYDSMAPLYYLSPVTLVKSLGNGEVFAYRANLIEKAFKKEMGDVLSKSIASFDMKEFMGEVLSGNGEAYLATLKDSIAPELLKKMEKFIGQQERWNKLAYNFSAISRARDDITKRLNEMIEKRLGGEINEVIGKRLLEVGFIQQFGKTAVETWMEKGGLRPLVRGLVNAALQAIGFSIAGPLGQAVASVVSWIATEVIMKIAKPVIKVSVKFVVFFVGGCFTLVLVTFGSFFLMVFGKFSHVAPNEIVMCEAYADLNLTPIDPTEFPDFPPGSGGEPIDFQCGPGETVQGLFSRMASEMGLSGVNLDLIPPGHELYGDLDAGWWCWAYSMDQIYCKSDKVNSCNDTIVRLFKHELVHLKQYRNASGSYGGLFMEWGADWLSGNGGGYSFTNKEGACIKATQTPMLPGCSAEIYRGIAYNEAQYINNQCFASIKSYITGFCSAP
jgi:hypothetical protein